MGHILLEAIAKGGRYGNDLVALWRFGPGDNIPAVEPLIALIDGDSGFLEVYISWGKYQQFALSHACIVQCHKEGITGRTISHDLNKRSKLFFSPEQYLIRIFLTHTACLVAGVLF